MGILGSLLDRLRGSPDARSGAEPPSATSAPAGRGPYREAAASPVAPGRLVLERLPRFAGWELVGTLDGDGEHYARYQIAPPAELTMGESPAPPPRPEHALACFAVDPLADEGWFAIAFDEARIFMRLDHQNLGRVIAIEAEGPIWWHLSERPRGVTLDRLLARVRYGAPRPPIDVIAAAFADFAAGLHAAHGKRDDDDRPLGFRYAGLRPSSLLLGLDGVGRVVDWGLAGLVRAHGPPDGDAETGDRGLDARLREGLPYFSPEESLARDVDARADVFTLGAMLHEACTGTSPFGADTIVETFQRLRHHAPPPLSTVVPGCPPDLDALAQRALAKDPAARCSAGEIDEGLRRGFVGARGVDPRALIAGYVKEVLGAAEG